MTRAYKGGCHCGAVRFEATIDPSNPITCNCSICGKAGHWLTFAPADNFKLESGENNLTDYQFNKKTIHHLFCKTCGIRSFARGKGQDGTEMIAINVRCLDDIDVDTLEPKKFNGKDL
jgi:hypothetical protein